MIAAFCMITLLAAAQITSPPSTQPAAARRMELHIHPAAPPRPALRYVLMPDYGQQTPGNAAPLYLMAFELLPQDRQGGRISDLLAMPLKQFPKSEAVAIARNYSRALDQVAVASTREHCAWDLPYRQTGVETTLPFLAPAREAALALALQARLQIIDGQYDDAIRSLRTGFTLARHLQNDGAVIQGLVATAINELMLDRIADLQQSPGTPNLYWALADLPVPLIDRRTLSVERSWLSATMPELRDREPEQIPADELRVIFRKIEEMGGTANPGRRDEAPSLETAIAMVSAYGAAREYLATSGKTAEQIDRMPVESVLAIYFIDSYRRSSDEAYKWANLPYWIAAPHVEQSLQELASLPSLHTNPLMILMPALNRPLSQFVAVERKRGVMQMVEGLRAFAASHEGRLPAALDELTETPAPQDPVTGKAFDYRAQGQTATIHLSAIEGRPRGQETVYEITVR